MANLNSNTTYNTSGTQKSPLANLSNVTKLLQENAQKTSADTFKSSLMAHYNPSTFSSLFGANKPVSYESSGAPVDQPALPTDPTLRTQPLPSGYNQFTPVDEKGNWATPSEQVVARNWPSALGGGQYITDPTQPGKMIKSDRAIMDERLNPGAKQKLLGNLSPSLYQVDHIIPLWAGGADTLNNLQILDLPTHEKKTAIQAVALTLLANKKIDLNEARNLSFTWKDKDASGLPSADEIDQLGGYIPLTTAEKMVQKWKDDISKPNTMKYFGESFREEMGKFGEGWLPDIVREPIKGFVGGALAGIVPGTGASEDSGKAAQIANVVGNIAGTIFGLGKFAKGLSWTTKGIRSLTGTAKAVGIAEDAMKTTGLVTDIGNLTAKTINAKKRAETLTRMASTAGLLSLWGQVGLTGREATGQVDAEFSNHVKQFFSDIAFGTLLGSAGQNVKGYARVGLGTAALSLMEGEDIGPALQNAGLMTALHGMAYKRGMLDPKVRMGGEEAYKMSAFTMNQYVGDVVPTVKRGQPIPEILKLDIPKLDSMRVKYQQDYPNDQRFKNLGTITNNEEAIHFIEQASKRQLGNLISKSNGAMSQEQIKQEMTRIVTAKNQLYNQTLPPEARAKKEWEDLVSMGTKLKTGIKTEQIRSAANSNENLNKIPKAIPNETYDNTNGITFPVGKGGITGYGDKIDVEAKKNIDDFAKNPDKYDGKIYIPKTDAETATIQRFVNGEYVASGKPAPTEVPEHTLRAFVRTTEGEFKPVGYMPQEGSFNAKKYDLNMTYREQINRFRHTIETAKSPEQLVTLFGKDKAGISIDQKVAETLLEKKATLTDEELYSLLKPRDVYHKLDSNLNNTNLFKKMDELGIDNLVVDPLKAWEINGVRPRYNPDNPYLNLDISEQDWLRSLAIKNGTPGKAVTPEAQDMTKTIEKIINQQKAQKTSEAIKEVLPKVKASEIARGVPFSGVKSPVEASKTPEMSNMTSTEEVTPKLDYSGKTVNIESRKGGNPSDQLVNEFFNDMVHDIEYRKVKPTSPQDLEKVYMNIVDAFKRKNPGLPEADFKNAINDAKARARSYVQDLVDDTYKGTKIFGTEDTYSRTPKAEVTNVLIKKYNELNARQNDPNVTFKANDKVELADVKDKITQHVQFSDQIKEIRAKATAENRGLTEAEQKRIYELNKKKFTLTQDYLGPKDKSLVLANKFDLKLQPPNDAGIQYLELDKRGNPMFSDEYIKSHPNVKNSPIDTYGSFLEGDMKEYRDTLSVQSKDWAKGIERMKASNKPYAKGFASAIDKALGEKYNIKNPKTGEVRHGWEGSWKLNSALKNMKTWFRTTNEEGHLESQPFRRTVSISAGKDYNDIKKAVAKADAKTREISEKAREARINDMSSGKAPDLPSGMRVKDINQIQNVSEDLTPFDMMTNGLLATEVRNKLIERYNDLRLEMRPGIRQETRVSPTGENVSGTMDEMTKLLTEIKKLSTNIPESKDWKPGAKIVLKGNGEPTFEEGVKDGLRVAGNIFKIKKSPGFVNFDKIKELLLEAEKTKKDGSGGPYDGQGGPYDGQGGFFSGLKDFIKHPFSSVTHYQRPPDTSYDVRGLKVNDNDINEASDILYGEISNREPDKQQFEVRHAINTAINRAQQDPKRYNGSIVSVLQAPSQYQSYAPEGINRNGQIMESQYQKIKKGMIDREKDQKYQTIRKTLEEMKSGNFQDTTGGKTFYVHASDGTLWLGKTTKEAKDNANKHEKDIKGKRTNWSKLSSPVVAQRSF